MCVGCEAPSTSRMYYLNPRGSIEQGLKLIIGNEEVLYMRKIHAAWPTNRITLYVDSGEEPLQVVGNEGVGDEGVVGDESVIGDEGDELNELMCYDWMNDRLQVIDFTDDIFGGNKGHNASYGEHAETSTQYEVGGNEGNNSSHVEHVDTSWQHDVGGNVGNNASNAQPSM